MWLLYIRSKEFSARYAMSIDFGHFKKIPTSCVVFVIFFFLLYILGPSNLFR